MRIRIAVQTLLAGLTLAGTFALVPAQADRGDWHRGDDWHFDRGGRWFHGDHDGRLGWWWVTGLGLWYYYPRPAYPYPYGYPYDPYYGYPYPANPPVVVVPQQPAAPPPPAVQQYWYYCEAAKAYYPYVSTCPGGWRKVPATPPATVDH